MPSHLVPPRLVGLLAAQGGLVSTAQARDHGVEPRHLIRAGTWVGVRPGVYADATVWGGADTYRARPRLRNRAALMRMERVAVLSHDSAAFEHDLPVLGAQDSLVHVTRPGLTTAWVKAGVKVHLASYAEEQVVTVDGVRALDVPRTVADLAREHGFPAGVVAADAAMAGGVSRAALTEATEVMTNWPGVRTARSAVDFADRGAETPHESLGRILVTELGMGTVDTQFPVRTPRGVVWCDLRIGNHVFETDGKIKYRDARRGGLRKVDPDELLWDEKVRERLIRDEGLGVSRIFWADHWNDRRTAALERLRRDLADTVALRGTDLAPRLAANAVELRRTRPRVRSIGA